MNLRDEFLVFTSPFPDPAGDGKKHWAGAQRPKAETLDKNLTGQPIRAAGKALDDRPLQPSAGNCGNKILGRKNLSLKLREQAKKLGLIPGSPRWRAYVLGTVTANKKRKRKKGESNFADGVTPAKCLSYETKLIDNRTTPGKHD